LGNTDSASNVLKPNLILQYNMSLKNINRNLLLLMLNSAENDVVVNISKTDDDNTVIVHISKKIFSIFGYKFYKNITKEYWNIDPAISSDKDVSVDCAAYMNYAKNGFNENKIDILEVFDGMVIPEEAKKKLEEFNYRLDLLHCAVGMVDEAGEILDHIKKYVYHDKPFDKAAVASEFGDQSWYHFNALRLMDIKFSDTLEANKIKLNARYPNGRSKNYLAQVESKNTKREDELIQKEIFDKKQTP
jgi:NTP pyrophosphatase (non-canonical NTP hydrolase)